MLVFGRRAAWAVRGSVSVAVAMDVLFVRPDGPVWNDAIARAGPCFGPLAGYAVVGARRWHGEAQALVLSHVDRNLPVTLIVRRVGDRSAVDVTPRD
jgi:hypothetical protein